MPRGDGASDLVWRALSWADLPDLDALLSATEDADQLGERHDCEDLYEAYETAGPEAAELTLVGRDDDDALLAYGWLHPQHDGDLLRLHLRGAVHPSRRRRGLGRVLLQHQLEQARSWSHRAGPLQVVAYADERQHGQRRLYESLGLQPVRWFADLSRDLGEQVMRYEPPEGVRIVPLSRKRFEAVRVAHNESFADHWGARPVGAEDWERQLLRPQSRLSWSWVALVAETSEVVGYATSSASEQEWDEQGYSEGWTDRLGVRPGWRNQGVAQALLSACLRSFNEAGLDRAGIGVDSDSPSRALALYESLGYRAVHTVVMHTRSEPATPPGGALAAAAV